MPLEIKYSIKLEEKRIKNTLEKLSWYEKLGYSPRFPQKIDPKKDDIKKIYAALQNDFIEEDYAEVAKKVNEKFSKIESVFYKNLQEICGKKIKRNFKLIFTKYGVGGSYGLPDKIIYNIAMKSSSVNTICHEITHLLIEPYITKYQIQQNEKERIVDLILTSEPIALPDYKMQKRGEECKRLVDPLFNKHFKPPIYIFFKKLKEAKNNTKNS